MSDKVEVAKKIVELINSQPRSPTVDEIAGLLSELSSGEASAVEPPESRHCGKYGCLQRYVDGIITAYGLINVLDGIASSKASLLDLHNPYSSTTTWRQMIQKLADSIQVFADTNSIRTSARLKNQQQGNVKVNP